MCFVETIEIVMLSEAKHLASFTIQAGFFANAQNDREADPIFSTEHV
jgi:hypothetical protein